MHEAKNAPERLALGSTFGMSMKVGIPYSMRTRSSSSRRTAASRGSRASRGRCSGRFGGRIWRYELEPVDGGTLVRESWDISGDSTKALVRPGRKKTRKSMEQTLARIEELVTSAS